MKARSREAWWTRERVIEGLLRFYREYGVAPTSTKHFQELTRSTAISQHGVGNSYPSFYGVLKHFANFRDAWAACGVPMDRGDVPWTPEEEWFIAEACGILSRIEIASYLNRTPDAVHRRLYDLGLHSYRQHGWTLGRIERVANLPSHVLRKYIERGELPVLRGTKCVYCDPADLLVVREIDWDNPPNELGDAARQSLMQRLVKILTGQDWRFGRPYKFEFARTTTKRWRNARTFQPTAKPVEINPGDMVRVRPRSVHMRPLTKGRIGVAHMVFFSGNRQKAGTANVDGKPCWKARVEFKRSGDQPRLNYTLPLTMLSKAEAAK